MRIVRDLLQGGIIVPWSGPERYTDHFSISVENITVDEIRHQLTANLQYINSRSTLCFSSIENNDTVNEIRKFITQTVNPSAPIILEIGFCYNKETWLRIISELDPKKIKKLNVRGCDNREESDQIKAKLPAGIELKVYVNRKLNEVTSDSKSAAQKAISASATAVQSLPRCVMDMHVPTDCSYSYFYYFLIYAVNNQFYICDDKANPIIPTDSLRREAIEELRQFNIVKTNEEPVFLAPKQPPPPSALISRKTLLVKYPWLSDTYLPAPAAFAGQSVAAAVTKGSHTSSLPNPAGSALTGAARSGGLAAISYKATAAATISTDLKDSKAGAPLLKN